MRHRVYGRKLGRNKNERNSLFRSLMQELFLHGTITTSQTKASAIKGTVDKIINLAKNTNSQRFIQSFFVNKLLQERLIKEIAPKMQNRNSGYTSLVKVGVQQGDRTTLVKMSLIGLEELKPLQKESRVKSQESREETVEKKEVIKLTPKTSRPTKTPRSIRGGRRS